MFFDITEQRRHVVAPTRCGVDSEAKEKSPMISNESTDSSLIISTANIGTTNCKTNVSPVRINRFKQKETNVSPVRIDRFKQTETNILTVVITTD